MFFKKKVEQQKEEERIWHHVCYYTPPNDSISELLLSYEKDGTKKYKTVKVTTGNYDNERNKIIAALETIEKKINVLPPVDPEKMMKIRPSLF